MKKLIIILALYSIGIYSVSAQTPNVHTDVQPPMPKRGIDAIPNDMPPPHDPIHDKINRPSLPNKLNLTEEQKTQLKEIHVKRREALRQRKEQNREFHMNLQKKTENDIDAILTPEQKVTMQKIREDRKLRKASRGDRPARPHLPDLPRE